MAVVVMSDGKFRLILVIVMRDGRFSHMLV